MNRDQAETVEKVDVAILGTGPIESLISAAISKAGKKTFHLSEKRNYGENYATCSLVDFLEELVNYQDVDYSNIGIEFPSLMSYVQTAPSQKEPSIKTGDENVAGTEIPENISNQTGLDTDVNANTNTNTKTKTKNKEKALILYEKIKPFIHPKLSTIHGEVGDFSVPTHLLLLLEELVSKSRLYQLELRPGLVPCRGNLVDLLVNTTQLGQFLEFKAASSNLLLYNTSEGSEKNSVLANVPDSKQAIFSDSSLSFQDRLKLSKTLKFITQFTAAPEHEQQDMVSEYTDFASLLEKKFGLSGRIFCSVMYSICGALSKTQLSVGEGIARFNRYAKSIGRYGNMAYLYPLYGGGSELSQVFCRASAVAGGMFMMESQISKIEVKSGEGVRVEIEGFGAVEAERVVMSPRYLSKLTTTSSNASTSTNASNKYEADTEVDIVAEEEKMVELARGVFLVDGMGFGDKEISLITVPSSSSSSSPGLNSEPSLEETKVDDYPVYFLQVPGSARSCPMGKTVVYGWTLIKEKERASRVSIGEAYERIRAAFTSISLGKFKESKTTDSFSDSDSNSDSNSNSNSNSSSDSDSDFYPHTNPINSADADKSIKTGKVKVELGIFYTAINRSFEKLLKLDNNISIVKQVCERGSISFDGVVSAAVDVYGNLARVYGWSTADFMLTSNESTSSGWPHA